MLPNDAYQHSLRHDLGDRKHYGPLPSGLDCQDCIQISFLYSSHSAPLHRLYIFRHASSHPKLWSILCFMLWKHESWPALTNRNNNLSPIPRHIKTHAHDLSVGKQGPSTGPCYTAISSEQEYSPQLHSV